MANENVKVKKPTKTERFTEILSYIPTERTDLIETVTHEIELIAKKKSNGNSKANKQTEENVELVYGVLAQYDRKVTISELIATNQLNGLSNGDGVVSSQRVSAYLNKLVDGGRAEKIKDGKKVYFKVVEDATDED